MRCSLRTLALAMAGLSVVATAQVPMGAIKTGLDILRSKDVFPAGVPNPLAPDTASPTSAQPLPKPTEDPNVFKIIRAGKSSRFRNEVTLTEGVEFLSHGYHVFADSAKGNIGTSIFNLEGHVKMIGEKATVDGSKVTADLKNRSYRAYDAKSVLSPELTKGQVKGDVYTHGKESFGTEGETRTYDGGVTTCDKEHPHFEVLAEDTVVRPGRRAIFRRAKLQIFGHTILTIPYLSIPLDDRTYQNLPQIGQSPDEGYYIKNHYGIPLRGDSSFNARLDYMSKLGIGYGGDLGYRTPNASGLTSIYLITGMTDSFVMHNQHKQQFSFGAFALDNSISRNNYLTAPGSTLISTRAQLVMPQRTGATTTLSMFRSSNEASSSKSESKTISVSDDRPLSKKTRTVVDLSWVTNSNQYGLTSTNSEEMDVRFRGTHDLNRATAALEYQRNIPIGDNPSFFPGADQTPVFSLESDSRRLINPKFDEVLPFRTSLSFGQFLDPSTKGHLTRSFFDVNFNKSDRSDHRFKADFNGMFRQGIYSDDTAQYVLGAGSNLSYRLGSDTSANIRYNYMRPEGFSPLNIDNSGQSHQATADITVRPQKYVLVGAQTGYDFLRAKTSDVGWQQVGLRTEFRPSDDFSFRALSTYDTYSEIWTGVRLDFNYRAGKTTLSIGTRYDGYRGAWSNANLYLSNLKLGRVNLSAILSYNGFTKQFDNQQYSATVDLTDCVDAVFTMSESQTGFRPGREFQFFVRLKAIPFDSIFGLGQRGQPLGTSTGRDF